MSAFESHHDDEISLNDLNFHTGFDSSVFSGQHVPHSIETAMPSIGLSPHEAAILDYWSDPFSNQNNLSFASPAIKTSAWIPNANLVSNPSYSLSNGFNLAELENVFNFNQSFLVDSQEPFVNCLGTNENALPGFDSQKPSVSSLGTNENALPGFDSQEPFVNSLGTNENALPGFDFQEPFVDSLETNENALPGFDSQESFVNSLGTNENTLPGFGPQEPFVSSLGTNENALPGFDSQEPFVNSLGTSENTLPGFGSQEPFVNSLGTNENISPGFDSQEPFVNSLGTNENILPGFGSQEPFVNSLETNENALPGFDSQESFVNSLGKNENALPGFDFQEPFVNSLGTNENALPGFNSSVPMGMPPSFPDHFFQKIDPPTEIAGGPLSSSQVSGHFGINSSQQSYDPRRSYASTQKSAKRYHPYDFTQNSGSGRSHSGTVHNSSSTVSHCGYPYQSQPSIVSDATFGLLNYGDVNTSLVDPTASQLEYNLFDDVNTSLVDPTASQSEYNLFDDVNTSLVDPTASQSEYNLFDDVNTSLVDLTASQSECSLSEDVRTPSSAWQQSPDKILTSSRPSSITGVVPSTTPTEASPSNSQNDLPQDNIDATAVFCQWRSTCNQFVSQAGVRDHIKRHLERDLDKLERGSRADGKVTLKCPWHGCDSMLLNSGLLTHIWKSHAKLSTRRCQCGKSFSNDYAFRRHWNEVCALNPESDLSVAIVHRDKSE